jgi:hypothetical protein
VRAITQTMITHMMGTLATAASTTRVLSCVCAAIMFTVLVARRAAAVCNEVHTAVNSHALQQLQKMPLVIRPVLRANMHHLLFTVARL